MAIDIPEIFWTRLSARRCVAFVGAGFSVPAGYPAWGALITKLLEFCELNGSEEKRRQLLGVQDILKTGQYALAAHRLKLLHADDLSALRDCLKSVFSAKPESAWTDPKRMRTRLNNLTSAPFAGIVTTNYDDLIEPEIRILRPIWYEVHGANVLLGNALHKGVPFYVKLHGDTWDSKLVLSADDYHRTYLANSLAQSFIEALMLSYHVVFIGSSVEDEILRIRIRLNYHFDHQIPVAYALLADNQANRHREQLLKSEANIEPVFYPNEDGSHAALDEFLRLAAMCSDPDPDQFAEGTEALSDGSLGRTNMKIMALVSCAPGQSLALDVFKNSFTLFGAYRGAERFAPYLEHLSIFDLRSRLEYLIAAGYLVRDTVACNVTVRKDHASAH